MDRREKNSGWMDMRENNSGWLDRRENDYGWMDRRENNSGWIGEKILKIKPRHAFRPVTPGASLSAEYCLQYLFG